MKRIYTPEEERERSQKVLELFTGIPASQITRHKPIVRIKLKGASSTYDKVKADKILRLLTGNI